MKEGRKEGIEILPDAYQLASLFQIFEFQLDFYMHNANVTH